MKFAILGWAFLLLASAAPSHSSALKACEMASAPNPACQRLESLERAVGEHLANKETGEALRELSELVLLSSEFPGKDHPSTRMNLRRYAATVAKIARPVDREPKSLESLRLMRSILGEEDPDTVQAVADYAVTLRQLDRFEEAVPLFETVLNSRLKTNGERDPKTILSLAQYADVLVMVDRRREAKPLSEKALVLSRELLGERNPITIEVMAIHALVLQNQGFRGWTEAVPLMEEALSLSQRVFGKRHPKSLALLFQYAEMSAFTVDPEQTAALFAKASDLSRETLGSSHPVRLKSLMLHVIAAMSSGNSTDALKIARDASVAWRQRAQELQIDGLRGGAQSTREFGFRQAYEAVLADVLWEELKSDGGDFEALSAEAFAALQYASSASNSRAVTEAAALRYSDRIGLRDLVQERRALIREWSAIEGEFVVGQALQASFQNRQEGLRTRLIAIERRVGQIDQDLAALAPEYFAILNQPAAPLDRVREILGTDEAVLLLVPGFFGWHSMAIDNQTVSWNFKLSLDPGRYGETILKFRKGMEIDSSGLLPKFDFRAAHELYGDLIEPVEKTLEGKKRVYVVADGALSRLPLGTLLTSPLDSDSDGSAGTADRKPYPDQTDDFLRAHWLADRYALVQLPSLQSLVYIRTFGIGGTADGNAGFVGFGAPVLRGSARLRGARTATLDPIDAAGLVSELRGSSGLPLMNPEALRKLAALPGTRVELEQVRKALGAPQEALYLDERMTEAAIRHADLSATRILHLATHGFTSEESGETAEPGLVFTPPNEAGAGDDGYLAASEVVGLNLSLAEWVILSACNTASPSGKPGETGLSGLAQAFFYAGAESLLVSHWPVFDDIAPLLTVEALKRSRAGVPRAEALQAAMRAIRENAALDAAHPAVWAPFTLVGEGR